MADNKKAFADNLNLIWKFYKEHSGKVMGDNEWNQLNEEYKKLIEQAEPKYKTLIEKGGLAAMEIINEEQKDNG